MKIRRAAMAAIDHHNACDDEDRRALEVEASQSQPQPVSPARAGRWHETPCNLLDALHGLPRWG
jgi:hypothetical protein